MSVTYSVRIAEKTGVNLRPMKPHIRKSKEGWIVHRIWAGDEEKAIYCLNFATRLNKGIFRK